MPEGQFTGDRARYVYESDDGTKYRLFLDTTLATAAGSGEGTPGTGLVADTPEAGAQNKPTKFKPRCVFWQGTLGGTLRRKALICGTTEAGLYTSKTPVILTIDGVTGVTTGRRGEQMSY